MVLNASKVISNSAGLEGGGIMVFDEDTSSVALRNGSSVSGNQPDQCIGTTCAGQTARLTQKQKRR